MSAERSEYDNIGRNDRFGAINKRRREAGLTDFKNGSTYYLKSGRSATIKKGRGGPRYDGKSYPDLERNTDEDIATLRKQNEPKEGALNAMYKNDPRFEGEAPTRKAHSRMSRILTGTQAGSPRTTALGG
jgi:hypothetical protein